MTELEIAFARYQHALTQWLNWSNWVDDEKATFLAIAKDEAEAAYRALLPQSTPTPARWRRLQGR